MSGDLDRPTVREVVPLARRLFEHSDGCCLHIVLSDENVKDSNVDFCIAYAMHAEHWECLAVAKLLAKMTRSQRMRVARRMLEHAPSDG